MKTSTRHVYEYTVDPGSNTASAFVARLVGSSKRVLEIGCGPGSITKVLAQQGQCQVTGIELDPAAIEKATPFCDTIIQGDLNDTEWPHLVDNMPLFDVVVAADVLEHLYNPWTTLKQMAPLIKPNGCLVISLPHVGHAVVASCLITGNFEYRDWGLLDRTHIRFFGLKNIEELFAQADLKIVEANYVIKTPEETEFAENWSKLTTTVQNALRSSPHADIYQVVVKAVPNSHPDTAISLIQSPQTIAVNRKASWKSRIARHLSNKTKQRIRAGLGRLGIRI
jgi:2-polyprenyl-3-methyl-5-hydroxy-6-metoxy-1,4-benzoquinol methylase